MKEAVIMEVIGKSTDGETSEDEIEMNFILDRMNENQVEIRLDDGIIAVADLANVLESMKTLIEVFSRKTD